MSSSPALRGRWGRESVSTPPLPADVRDERALMGLTAGALWLVAAATTIAGALLPGSPDVDPALFAGLEAFIVIYGIGCVTGLIPWDTVSMRTHAVTTALLLPLIGVGIW